MPQQPHIQDTLQPDQLHDLWGRLSEDQRLPFLGSLSDEAAQQLLAYQLRLKEPPRPKLRTPRGVGAGLETEAQRPAPTYPAGEPTDHWTDAELAAFIAHKDKNSAGKRAAPQVGAQSIWRKA